jgi:hypothetical protein
MNTNSNKIINFLYKFGVKYYSELDKYIQPRYLEDKNFLNTHLKENLKVTKY